MSDPDYKYVGPGWRAQVGVLEWAVEEILGSRLVQALDATFPPTPGWNLGPRRTVSAPRGAPRSPDPAETLALIEQHRLTVTPEGDGWYVRPTAVSLAGGRFAMTIGEAVRTCVARIKEAK